MSGLIDQVVSVSISATTATPSLPGFGFPAIIAYHTHWTDRIRWYTDLPGMVTDGFTTSEPAYRMARSILQQSPHVKRFAVIRASTAIAQGFTFEVTDNTVGHSVGFTLVHPDGTTTDCHHTVTTGQTLGQVATAIAGIVDPLSGIGASATEATVTATGGTAGEIWYVTNVAGGSFQDTTADASADDDLDATLLIDNSWYGISGAWLSPANIANIAAWAETAKRLHGYTTMDEDARGSGTGVGHTLKGQNYSYSYGLWSASALTYAGTGLMGGQLVAKPGSNNWAFKQVKGTAVDALTPTHQTRLAGNNLNCYVEMAGVPITFDGRTASGQFIDTTVGIDSLTRYVQLQVATLLTTLPKLEYTRAGMALARGAVKAGIEESVSDGFILNESGYEPQVSIPDLEDVSAADKADRVLNNVYFTCYARGAINKIQISGVVNI